MQSTKRPNIVFILSDDQGAWALGSAGNTEVHTPNLDRLAASGMRFENFFCTSPVCSPARASILTGRMPSSHGVQDWIRSGSIDVEDLEPALQSGKQFSNEFLPIEYLEGMSAYTEVLADNGYTCGLSGKWHLGHSIKPQKGFTYWEVIARGGCSYMRPEILENGQWVRGEQYLTDYISDNAVRFIEMEGDEPFYLSVHYTAPHTPWGRDEHPQEVFSLYDDCPCLSIPEQPLHRWQIASCAHGSGEHRKELIRGYYAAITAMDRGIGRILDALEQKGLLDNTIIFFTSDNGMNLGQHGIWGKGNGTFPQNMFDTSVKVPMIISHSGTIAAGQVVDHLLSHYDLYPTILDYLGLAAESDSQLRPGASFAPLLRGDAFEEENPVIIYDEYGPVRMIRNRQYKYVHRYPYGPHELYDLGKDPDETENLVDAAHLSAIVETLRQQLEEWFCAYSDPGMDGARQPVYGTGQLHRPGKYGQGKKAFVDEFKFVKK